MSHELLDAAVQRDGSNTNRLTARKGQVEQGDIGIGGITRGCWGTCSKKRDRELKRTAKSMSLHRGGLTREQFCFGIQLRVDLDTHGQFPVLPRGLLRLFAQLLLCLESFGLLFELLAEGDAVCRGGLETASRRETSGINLGASQEGPIDPAENADSAAGPWPEHGGGIVGGAEAVRGFERSQDVNLRNSKGSRSADRPR